MSNVNLSPTQLDTLADCIAHLIQLSRKAKAAAAQADNQTATTGQPKPAGRHTKKAKEINQ
jgi:hypothetical protein